jgi:hypothetical protein
MADFETELSGMFQTAVDPAIGPALAEAALARIAREDHRRSLALTLAGVAGVVIAGASGAPQAARELIAVSFALATAPVQPMALLWPVAALGVAVGAIQLMRTSRAL